MPDLNPETFRLLEMSRALVEAVQRRDFEITSGEFPEGDELRDAVDLLEEPSLVILDLLIVIDALEKRLITQSLHALEGGT